VTLLLATDAVTLYDPGEPDAAGWAEPPEDAAPRWCGAGNLQLAAGTTDQLAGAGGGHGPHDPARTASGLLFLPIDACPRDGQSAHMRGRMWVLGDVRLVQDPAGAGLDCWLATATARGTQ
jgi:hypothetical protein